MSRRISASSSQRSRSTSACSQRISIRYIAGPDLDVSTARRALRRSGRRASWRGSQVCHSLRFRYESFSSASTASASSSTRILLFGSVQLFSTPPPHVTPLWVWGGVIRRLTSISWIYDGACMGLLINVPREEPFHQGLDARSVSQEGPQR